MNHEGLIPRWEAPTPGDIGTTVEEFLAKLGGPTFLWFPGLDPTRTRAVSTLLHGNEPSGLRALHRWIQEQQQPCVNILCFIGSVDAALTQPVFSHRCAPNRKDLNRCFSPPFEGPEGSIALAMLQELHRTQPETLIDLHNTSGRSPAYGVTTRNEPMQQILTGIFCDHLMITDLRLGTLMEATETAWPTVTIESGGAQDSRAHELAYRGFSRYASTEHLTDLASPVTVAHHPIRVELQKDASLAYASTQERNVDLTLLSDVDRLNFGTISTQERLGWLGSRGLDVLWARDATGQNLTTTLFSAIGGELRVTNPSRLMMATTNPEIAQSDCLFYLLPEG